MAERWPGSARRSLDATTADPSHDTTAARLSRRMLLRAAMRGGSPATADAIRSAASAGGSAAFPCQAPTVTG